MVMPRNDKHYTYADYKTWDDGNRYELLDGAAYMMAAPSVDHQRIVTHITTQLTMGLRGQRCEAFASPLDVRLPRGNESDDDVDRVVQPDVLVYCDPTRLDDKGGRGAPDLVVEVLSPSTASHDLIRKRRLYEQVGVRELWFVHPGERYVDVYRLVDGVYGKPEIVKLEGETPVAVLSGVTIPWQPLLDRLGPLEP